MRSILGALVLVAACIALAAIIAGCQPGEKPSTADLLIEAENVVTAGIETVGRAVQIGTLRSGIQRVPRHLQRAEGRGRASGCGRTAYRGGDMGAADESRRAARRCIRPSGRR